MIAPRILRRPDMPLRRRGRLSPAATLLFRVLLALALMGVALAGHWFDRGGLRDNVDGQISFPDVLYFTTVTVTTVGFGDIVPVTERARMFDTFVVTPIRLFVWLIFLGTAYDFVLKRSWERFRMRMIQRGLHGHVVIAGFGTSGAEAMRELIARGTSPDCIVVVDRDEGALSAAEGAGVAVLAADATRDRTLDSLHIGRAAALIVSAGRDDTSILIVLTARGLAPNVPISVVVRSGDNEALARQAGANVVINPVSFAGLLLAGSTKGPHIADYLADLAASDGRVALRERKATDADVGRPLSAVCTGIAVRLYRDGQAHSVWDPASERVEAGDLIVEICPGT